MREELLNLISNFEKETWKFEENEKLYEDMQFVYSMEKDIKSNNEVNLEQIRNKLLSLFGMIRFKYGHESTIIKSNPELTSLKNAIENISLDSNDIISQYNNIFNLYNNYVNNLKNLDFIKNNYENIEGKEGLYLAVESLKTLITNNEYRQLLNQNQINDILIDCMELNNNSNRLKMLESKYKEIIQQIWEHSLSNGIDDENKFKILFSNISGGSIKSQAELLLNRPEQSSCSMISSNFIATYGSNTRKVGFIYPNNSTIINASAYDLGSNVFGTGAVNKEKGSFLATPEVLEKIGIERAKNKGEDLYSSSCYNEVLVESKPYGIVIVGLGENDLNIDLEEAKELSQQLNLPLYFIDTMQYKTTLSDNDKEYIAFHSVLSYLGISYYELHERMLNNDKSIYELIEKHKDQITDAFIKLKKEGNLNKENMNKLMSSIMTVSKSNSESEVNFIATKDINEVAKIHSDSKYINWRMEFVDGEYRFYSPNYKKQEIISDVKEQQTVKEETYVSLEDLESLLSEQGYMCFGHGTGRFGNSEEVVDSIFSQGLRTKDNSLYFTTIGLSTPTPELKQQYKELGLPAPTIDDLKKQFNSWQHQDSKNIIIARVPTEYINMSGDRSDLDGEMYGAFMREELSSEGKITNYLDPRFIVGCFDVERQAVKLNSNFEKSLSPDTLKNLKARYIKALEKTKARIKQAEQILVPSEIEIKNEPVQTMLGETYDSFDFDDVEWDMSNDSQNIGKSR